VTDVTLSEDLVERLERRVQHTDFESADDYAEFVLSEVLARIEHDVERGEDGASRETVRDRLQSLGYLEE
jgi:Arc/MetJ-type ribon-helix-helix transcriptional regulator